MQEIRILDRRQHETRAGLTDTRQPGSQCFIGAIGVVPPTSLPCSESVRVVVGRLHPFIEGGNPESRPRQMSGLIRAPRIKGALKSPCTCVVRPGLQCLQGRGLVIVQPVGVAGGIEPGQSEYRHSFDIRNVRAQHVTHARPAPGEVLNDAAGDDSGKIIWITEGFKSVDELQPLGAGDLQPAHAILVVNRTTPGEPVKRPAAVSDVANRPDRHPLKVVIRHDARRGGAGG